MNAKVVQKRLPCPQPNCNSSDAYHLYEDGHGYCFSCKQWTKSDSSGGDRPDDSSNPTFEYLAWRAVSSETMAFFDVRTRIDKAGEPEALGFPYGDGAFKVRKLASKQFYSVGPMSSRTLFGKSCFSAGQAMSVTIAEGEMDAMSIFQMLGSKFPVVSVRSASSAAQDCAKERDWLNAFDKIYLCFDNDEPGRKAASEVARLFDFNKVYHVKLDQFKDANDYLTNGKAQEFKHLWFNARRFLPEGIISSYAEIDQIIDEDHGKTGLPYPYRLLQEKTYGLRTGECVLLTAFEGVGKTEVIRSLEYNVLKTTDDNIGIIHLEENKARIIKGLVGYELATPAHLPDSTVSDDDVKATFRAITRRDERVHIYSHFGSDDPDVILDTIRFLVTACGCKYIFLDHITMVVTGLKDDEQTRILDYLSTQLAMMVESLDFALVFVSHVNDDGRTRGSRNISKIADLWIHLDRDLTASDQRERNTTKLTIMKNRFAGPTGPAGVLTFDPTSFTLKEHIQGALPH